MDSITNYNALQLALQLNRSTLQLIDNFTLGQAFADEIFRVFKQKHPDIKIEPINMVEPVKFMIDRVEKPALSS